MPHPVLRARVGTAWAGSQRAGPAGQGLSDPSWPSASRRWDGANRGGRAQGQALPRGGSAAYAGGGGLSDCPGAGEGGAVGRCVLRKTTQLEQAWRARVWGPKDA